MSKEEKKEVIARIAALPPNDQRNLAFFVAGMTAKEAPKKDPDKKKGEKAE